MNNPKFMVVGTFQSTIVNSKPCDGTGMNRVLQKLPNIKHVYKKYNFTLVSFEKMALARSGNMGALQHVKVEALSSCIKAVIDLESAK